MERPDALALTDVNCVHGLSRLPSCATPCRYRNRRLWPPSAHEDTNAGAGWEWWAREGARARAAVRAMLHPRSIAIVGATPASNKSNCRPLHFLRRDGYPAPIWPVNPRYADIDGLKRDPDIAALPGAPDMAIIAVAALARAEATIAALGAKGCPVAVLFSSGFGELGAEGKALERSLIAHRPGKRRAHLRAQYAGSRQRLRKGPRDVQPVRRHAAFAGPWASPVSRVPSSSAFPGISALARSRVLWALAYSVSTRRTPQISRPSRSCARC